MNTSEEIAADYFIRHCKRRGITHSRGIIQEAKENPDFNDEKVSIVSEVLRNDMSNVSGVDEPRQCSSCGQEELYDEKEEEHYCPICQ